MYVQQTVSILFLLRRDKMTNDAKCPISARLTIDGLVEQISTGLKVKLADWNSANKKVKDSDPDYKTSNKKLRQIETDLERLVDLIQANDEVATPEKVMTAYRAPVKATQARQEKDKNETFSRAIDETVSHYLDFAHRYEKAHEGGKIPPSLLEARLPDEKEDLAKRIIKLAAEGKVMFDDTTWEKTLVKAINEHLLNFMEIAFSGMGMEWIQILTVGRFATPREWRSY